MIIAKQFKKVKFSVPKIGHSVPENGITSVPKNGTKL